MRSRLDTRPRAGPRAVHARYDGARLGTAKVHVDPAAGAAAAERLERVRVQRDMFDGNGRWTAAGRCRKRRSIEGSARGERRIAEGDSIRSNSRRRSRRNGGRGGRRSRRGRGCKRACAGVTRRASARAGGARRGGERGGIVFQFTETLRRSSSGAERVG